MRQSIATVPSDRQPGPDMGGLEPIHTTSAPFFFVVWIISIVVSIAVLETFTYFYVNYFSKPEPAWINNLFYQKKVIANRESGRGGRLMVFGGSGVLFGIDAELIEKKLGIPAVNYGIQGGLGVRYTLDRAMTVLQPGDTALIVIEYGGYGDEWRTNPGSFHSFLWTYDPAYMLRMSIREKVKMFWSVRLADYPDSFEGWIAKRSGDYFHLKETATYSVGSVGPNGDMRASPVGPVHQSDGPPFVGDPGIADLNAFRAFCREARAKNIKVLFSWPAYIRPRLSAGQTLDAPKYMTDLLGEGGMTALDSPADNMYPADFFLDSSYHLTAVGRRIHTEELIRRLRPMLGFAPASGAVKNVLLLAGREHRLTEGNLFAEDPQLEVRYLSKTRLSDPRTVTAEDAAQLVRDGINVFTDSDAAAAVLNAANLGERPSSAGIETIGHWFARHPSNIFMIGNAPGSRLDPAWRKVLPQAIYDGLSRGAIGCAVFGSGRYANVRRLVTGAGSALLQMNTSEVMPPGQHIPAYMEIECVGKESGGPSVRMNVDYLDVGKVNTGCFVVAIDPELGAVADTAVFDSNGQFPAWHLDRVVLEKGER